MARPSKHTAAPTGDAATTIGPAIQISGRIEGAEDLRVLGRVEGAIHLTETLFVDAEGIVQADVTARDVVISGIVLGNVTAENSVTLNPGARLIGNIAAPRLIISDGAAFAGDVEMGDAPPRDRADRARAASYVPTSASTARPAARSSARASARTSATRAPAPAAAAPASGRSTPPRDLEDEDVTVVIKHAELARGERAPAASSEESATVSRPAAPRKAEAAEAKKTRARVPSRGKRRVGRR